MFGMGMGELILIAVVALLALGPDKLPDAAKKIGRTIRDLRRQTGELKRTIEADAQLGDAMKEIRSALRDDPFRDPPRPRKKPAPPPTPADAKDKKPGAPEGDEPAVEPAEGAVAHDDEVEVAAAAEAAPQPADDAKTMPIEVDDLDEVGEVGAAEAVEAAAEPAVTEPVMINMSEYQRYVHMWGPEAAAEKYGTSLEEAEAAIRAVVGTVEREPSDG